MTLISITSLRQRWRALAWLSFAAIQKPRQHSRSLATISTDGERGASFWYRVVGERKGAIYEFSVAETPKARDFAE